MRNNTLIFILFGLGFFGRKNATQPTQPSDVFTQGNSWIYSNASFDSTGKAGASSIDTVSITSTQITGGKKHLLLSDGSTLVLISNGDWALSEVWENLITCSPYRIPSTPGDTVFMLNSVPTKVNGVVGAGNFVSFVKATGVTVTVPAGTFNCYEFELDLTIVNTSILARTLKYISSSVGVVKRETYQRDTMTGLFYLSDVRQLLGTK